MKQEIGRVLVSIGIVFLMAYIIGMAFQIDFLLLPIIAGYLIPVGIGLCVAKKEDLIFVVITITATYMVCFVSFASYGLAYIYTYLIGLALSLVAYMLGKSYRTVRLMSYIGATFVFLSCCYFLGGFLHNSRYIAILVGLIACIHAVACNIRKGKS